MGQLKDLKLQRIPNLIPGENELQNDEFYKDPGETLKRILTM